MRHKKLTKEQPADKNTLLAQLESGLMDEIDYSKIDWAMVPESHLACQDADGWTPLHWAAASSELKRVPRKFMTVENMSRPDCGGNSPLHVFTEHNNNLSDLPDSVLKLLGKLRNKKGWTPMHWISFSGALTEVPDQYITKETLLAQSDVGNTPMHYFVQRDSSLLHLKRLNLLDAETLLCADIDGCTPLHHCSSSQQSLNVLLGIKLPKEALEIVPESWYRLNETVIAEREADALFAASIKKSPKDAIDIDF